LLNILFFFITIFTTYFYNLSLHDALPIYFCKLFILMMKFKDTDIGGEIISILTKGMYTDPKDALREYVQNGVDANSDKITIKIRDRKSTRLNSSHRTISYAVFCLKKKIKK